jgi:hypothetical protein
MYMNFKNVLVICVTSLLGIFVICECINHYNDTRLAVKNNCIVIGGRGVAECNLID